MRVELSETAARICAERSSPLLVELELRFGCLVTKRAHFRDAPGNRPGALTVMNGNTMSSSTTGDKIACRAHANWTNSSSRSVRITATPTFAWMRYGTVDVLDDAAWFTIELLL